jgi:PAS domain S-box-containing protein/diguanylate cyclase (GGDEF)-like protein
VLARRDLFASVPLNELLLMLLTFISMVVTTGLVLVAVLGERSRSTDALRKKFAELEPLASDRALESGAALLQATERRYRAFFENAGIGIAHTDLKGRFVLVNPKFCEITGYSAEELLSKSLHDLLHADYLASSREYDARLADQTLAPHTVERRYVRSRGEAFWASATTSLVRDAQRQPSFFIHALQDVTERKRMEETLRRAVEGYRVIFDNSVAGIFTVNVAGRVLSANPALVRMLGYKSGDELAAGITGLRELYAEPGASSRFYELLLTRKVVEGFETRWRCKNGNVICVSLSARLVDDEIGGSISHIGMAEDITERIRLGEALREREAGLRRAQAMAKLGHVITGADGAFESWSETLPALIGVEPAQMPRSTREWLSIVHPDDQPQFRETAIRAAARRERADMEYRLQRSASESIYVRQLMEPLDSEFDADGKLRWFNTLQDITEQKRTENRIKRLNRVYAVLSGITSLIVRVRNRDELFKEACRIAVQAGQFPVAFVAVADPRDQLVKAVAWAGDERGLVQFNRPTVGAKGQGPAGLSAQAIEKRIPVICNDIEADGSVMRYAKEALERGYRSVAALPLVVEGASIGALVLYSAEAGFFDDEETKLLVELAGDISFALDHIDKAEKLDYLAYYDQLTGLANRMLFLERVAQKLIAAGSAKKVAVFALDVERFRSVNEALGRQMGDELLRQIADRFRKAGGDESPLARIGADQFAVVSADAQNEEQIARLAELRLAECFGAPFRIRAAEIRASAKVGIAVYPNDGADADTLLRNAEAALKKAKASGEPYLFYTQEMTERIAEKLALENLLRQAFEKEEFVLHYQPKVDLETRSIVGVEALIRWQSPKRGLVPPLQFIPLLEETGLILQVGSWALRRASLDHRGWAEQGLQAPRVAVNVSPIQLRQRNFVQSIEQAIKDGVAPTAIDMEITESLIMEDIQGNIEKLNAVRALGVNIAIDDFGTGYSSLGYLAKLPVQALKIDRSFINAMHKDSNAMTLVSTIISLAHSLQLKVIAEGVETEEQAKYLRLLRCDEMQGYLFSKPLPLDALVSLLRGTGGK